MYLADTGEVKVAAYISPAIDFTNTTGLHYAISIDDEQPQIININADKSETAWGKDVSNNIKLMISLHHIAKAGRHVLKYWMVDPAVVLQKNSYQLRRWKAKLTLGRRKVFTKQQAGNYLEFFLKIIQPTVAIYYYAFYKNPA